MLAADEAPFIIGDDGKMGWDAISDEIADADDSAKTGDNTPLAAVMVMMMISVMGLIFGNKKKRNA